MHSKFTGYRPDDGAAIYRNRVTPKMCGRAVRAESHRRWTHGYVSEYIRSSVIKRSVFTFVSGKRCVLCSSLISGDPMA